MVDPWEPDVLRAFLKSISVPASPEMARRYYSTKTVGYLINQAHLFRGLLRKGFPLGKVHMVWKEALEGELQHRRDTGEFRDRPAKTPATATPSTFHENNRALSRPRKRVSFDKMSGPRKSEISRKKR